MDVSDAVEAITAAIDGYMAPPVWLSEQVISPFRITVHKTHVAHL